MSEYLCCPECKGRCCRDHYRHRIKHMDAEFYEHRCDYCYDGSKYVPPRTAEEERAAVVAYLREEGSINSMLSVLKGAADEIERGEHRREENE